MSNASNASNASNVSNMSNISDMDAGPVCPPLEHLAETGFTHRADTAGFLYQDGESSHEIRNSHQAVRYDVCYCDGECEERANWFKVGQIRFTSFQLVSSAGNTSELQDEFLIEYVNTAGIMGFYRPWVDSSVLGLQQGGIVKFVNDSAMDMRDEDCRSALYDPSFAEWTTQNVWNPLDEAVASRRYAGTASDGYDGLIFNNGNRDHVLKVTKAGYAAVCYCSRVDDEGLCFRNEWVLAARMTIRGPTPNQHWAFSTHVTFRFNFTGWGISSDDKVRLIPSTAECTDTNGDPTASFDVTGIRIACPHPCQQIGDVTSALNGDISVKALASDAFNCNDHNEACLLNYVIGITVLDESRTSVRFQLDHGLTAEDHISLGEAGLYTDNIQCHPDDLVTGVCTEDRLAAVKGRFRLVDRDVEAITNAPDEYIAGHIVTPDPLDERQVTVPVGWAEPAPRFTITPVDIGSDDLMYAKWIRHSSATTALELMGATEQTLKVCWKYAPKTETSGARYVAEVGTLSLMDPNPLSDSFLSPTTTVKEQVEPYAPFIVSFKTAPASTAAGMGYHTVQGMTQLRVLFVKSLFLTPVFTDGAEILPNPGEDSILRARQYVCGKLFRELWSNDDEFGFPMPKGCYYRNYGETIELCLLFDPKNGMNSGKEYQLVLHATAQRDAALNGEYVHIFTMDDTDLKPYEAFERGIARLTKAPQEQPTNPRDAVKWLQPAGFKIVGGSDAEVMDLTGGAHLSVELSGDDDQAAGIMASCHLRMYLWPLTLWDLSERCTVVCTTPDEENYPCGAVQNCQGESVLAGFQKNIVHVVLPSSMSTISASVRHTLVFLDLVLPPGGFFSTRWGGQVTSVNDDGPDYIESSGDFLFKQADFDQGVGRLVNNYGDGNVKPFRGDQMNVLYANIRLAATLFAFRQTADARMTINLPPGYQCIRTLDINGDSPWRTPETLGIFEDDIPQGTGLPDEATGVRGWSVDANTCRYTLRQSAVVFAGSSLFIRITVNNPAMALRREDVVNSWNVTLESRGMHSRFGAMPDVPFRVDIAETAESYFTPNVAVLGLLTNARLVPTPFAMTIGQFGSLRFFFQTEQTTGVNSSLIIKTPPGFVFQQCIPRNLEDPYYATHGAALPTRVLPGVIECTYSDTPYHHLNIKMTGSMLAGQAYGFQVDSRSPLTYEFLQQDMWYLYTLSTAGFFVDGTRLTLPYVAVGSTTSPVVQNATEQSFGLYQQVVDVTVRIARDEMMPYSITGARTAISLLFQRNVLDGFMTTLRVVAPAGFIWDFTEAEFEYNVTLPNVTIPNVTQALPFGLPDAMDGNVLLWTTPPSVPFDPSQVYGFSAMIQVPDRSPTASANEFQVEFGHRGTTLEERFAAGAVTIRPVRALVNAAVDYETNVQFQANRLILQVQTITELPSNGMLRIIGPAGYLAASSCALEAAPPERGSPYTTLPTANQNLMLPDSMLCNASILDDGELELILTATSGLLPGRYRFQIEVTNPGATQVSQPLPGSACGYDCCWYFESRGPRSLEDNCSQANATHSCTSGLPAHLDAPTATTCFPVNIRMLSFQIPSLTPEQYSATGRDDRPLHSNYLVFAFRLTMPAFWSGELILRGPPGVIFREDCLEDLEIRGSHIFGIGQGLPADYSPIPPGISVSWCRGEGPTAVFYVNASGTTGLSRDILYPFRIMILINPAIQPLPNIWVVSYNGESSAPITSFNLWTFTRVSIQPVSTSVTTAPTLENDPRVPNPVTFTFRPYNTVRGVGMELKVTAPDGFEFAHVNFECSIQLQPITATDTCLAAELYGCGPKPRTDLVAPEPNIDLAAPEPNLDGALWLVWGDADIACNVEHNRRVLTATVLLPNREIIAHHDYQVTVFVHNPTRTVATGSRVWLLESYQSPGESGVMPRFRDLFRMPTYGVNAAARTWALGGEDGSDFRMSVPTQGGAAVDSFAFQVQFPQRLKLHDIVTIEAPRGFSLEAVDVRRLQTNETNGTDEAESEVVNTQGSSCNNLVWGLGVSPIPNSQITCVGNVMTFYVAEPSLPVDQLLNFSLNTRNPAVTPHAMFNNWVCRHTENGVVLASKVISSWEITPLLTDVDVQLIGFNKAAEAVSSIAISFRPASVADELVFTAVQPVGFNFTGARAYSLGHEVRSTNGNQITVGAELRTDVPVEILLRGVRLGRNGGPTTFDFFTRLNNQRKDELLGFTGGFVQPGRIVVLQQRIFSLYRAAPDFSSLWDPIVGVTPFADWDVRMSEETVVEIRFQVTRIVEPDATIKIRSPLYYMRSEGLIINRTETGIPQVSEVVLPVLGGELVARLVYGLLDNQGYVLRMRVQTPVLPEPQDSMWSIEICGCCDDCSLPINTNDGIMQGFRLVDSLTLGITVRGRVQPMTNVMVLMYLDPRSTRPAKILLIGPQGYTFTDTCLLDGGPNNEVIDCTPIQDKDGHPVARLTCQEDGLRGPVHGVGIQVRTPAVSSGGSWYVEARDANGQSLAWGEFAEGISVVPMIGASVVYPGLPQISGLMVFRFTINQKVLPGGRIQVQYPISYNIDCAGSAFEKVSLEGNVVCANYQTLGYFDVAMPRLLPPGSHAFGVTCRPPIYVNEVNAFSIKVLNIEGETLDSAMNVDGRPITRKLRITTMPLIWSKSEPRARAMVGFGLQLLQPLPEEEFPIMSELVIEVPPYFEHLVNRTSEFEKDGPDGNWLPTESGNWLNYANHTRLQVLLRESRTSDPEVMVVGQYEFSFPVLVPARMPSFNIWMLTVCGPRPVASSFACEGSHDPRALVTFPLAGFDLGESDPAGVARWGQRGGAQRRLAGLSSIWCSLLLLFLSPGPTDRG